MIFAQTWTQLGNNINGEADHDWFGEAIAINSDGTVMAVGALSNDGNGTDAGHVRVFEYSGSTWTQKGSDIDGEDGGDESGISVSISSDGSVVAIGAGSNDGNGSNAGHVRVYQFSGSDWVQKGADIDGDSLGSYCGKSVNLSADGSVVAIGSTTGTGLTYGGKVQVYQYSGSSWVQKGSDIIGDAFLDMFGYDCALSADGNTVAACSGSGDGYVRVYTYDSGSADWMQKGTDVTGENGGDFSAGASLDMNAYGTVFVIGATENDDAGTNAGHARVFVFSGSDWTQRGSDIDGDNAYDKAGKSVSINDAGDAIAIGAARNSDGAAFAGQVKVFKFMAGSWTQMGSDILGENAQDEFGTAVALNDDGTILAAAAPYCDATGDNMGTVRVFNNPSVSISEISSNFDLEIYPNPVQNTLSIDLSAFPADNYTLSVYSVDGKIVLSQEMYNSRSQINLSELNNGVYFLQIKSEKSVQQVQFIKQ
jgi:hypothetical protein